MTEIISILKSANVQKDEVVPPPQSPNAAGSDSDGDADDAGGCSLQPSISLEFLGSVLVITGTGHEVAAPARSFAAAAEVEWAVKALTNLIQVPCLPHSFSPKALIELLFNFFPQLAGGTCNPSSQSQALSFGALDAVAPLLLSRRQEIVVWACRCLSALVNGSTHVRPHLFLHAHSSFFGCFITSAQAHAAAVSLVVPRLIALADHHAEAAAALRVLLAVSPAAVAARDVFRSMDALLQQLPPVMFISAASIEMQMSIMSQLRCITCTRRASGNELGNVGGAVACNSFIILGGVRSLVACLKADMCANKVHCRLQCAFTLQC